MPKPFLGDGYDVTTTIDITMQDILEAELGEMLIAALPKPFSRATAIVITFITEPGSYACTARFSASI